VNGVSNFTNTQQYSIEIWFNPSNGQVNAGEAELLEKWDRFNEPRYPYTIRFNEGLSSMLVAVYDGNFTSVSLTGFSVNTWVQLAAVFDFVGDTLTVYRNGVSGGTVSLVGVGNISNTSPVAIATRLNTSGGSNSGIMFKGTVGIIRMYSTSLTSAQVLQNYNADKSKYIPVTPTPTPTTTSTPTVTPTNTKTPTPTPTSTEPFFILIQNGDILTAQDGSGIEYQH
jgi:hypothetical protein